MPEPEPESSPMQHGMIHLLYVDENPDICLLVSSVCEKTGTFAVHTLGSGAAAIAWLTSACVDVIVSADSLQGMTGLGFLRSVRRSGNTTPFILFAQDHSDQAKKEAFRSGANDVVSQNSLGRNDLSHLMRSLYWAVQGH